MPRVSVVIPVYNIEEHLRQCLDSVAGQTLREIEIICVDDGSTDSSSEILDEYAKKDARFHIIHQKNAGPGTARNRGMDEAVGEYLIFLDSDDWFEADFLEKMVKRAEETLADITICRSVEFDSNTNQTLPSEWMLKTESLPGNTFSPKQISNYIFQFTYGWPWDKLYRNEFIKTAKIKYPPLFSSEDLVFVYHSLVTANAITVIPEILVHHRINRMDSISNNRQRNPDDPYQALMLLKNILKLQEVYSYYEKSFLTMAIRLLIWNIAAICDINVQQQYYYKLKKERFPSLIHNIYFFNYCKSSCVYIKYIFIKCAPWKLFHFFLQMWRK